MFANNVCKYINITRVKHPCPTIHIKRSEQNDHILKKSHNAADHATSCRLKNIQPKAAHLSKLLATSQPIRKQTA